MYFVCPGCQLVLAVPAEKVPKRPLKYTCKGCGTVAGLQDNLRETRPGLHRPTGGGEFELPSDSMVGTVYHHVSGFGGGESPAARYELLCAVKGDDGAVRKYTFGQQRVVIGRKGADIAITDPLVSRVHAELERVRDRVVLKDLGSTNGTFCNDQQITAVVVESRDVIRVGNTSLKVAVRVS